MFDSLRKNTSDRHLRRLVQDCRALLSEEGEASGTSRAAATLAQYAALGSEPSAARTQRLAFFQALKRDFAPDAERVLAAAHAYAHEPSSVNLAVLQAAAEPPRQELLRRLNRAPGGTRAIVAMRVALLAALKADAELQQVDDDFRHLLSSWFNPGFLELRRVDWDAPATLLEQLIQHEAVHAVRDWNDLRRRLAQDRRCFAFFHPAIAPEPLIFVEVALLPTMADNIAPLLDSNAPAGDAKSAQTAVFYGISNCQPGLRGVSLGNFLIKRVVDVLSQEFPRIKTFCTLSPIPGFRDWLKEVAKGGITTRQAGPKLKKALARVAPDLPGLLALPVADLRAATARDDLRHALTTLAAAYLLGVGEEGGTSRDPVAHFHLNNGARLDRLNWRADESDKGLKQSLGLMVNYVYEPRRIEHNHEAFVRGQTIASQAVEDLV